VHDHRFVFIAGLHRSGTSLLFQCLREHPLISAFANTGVPEDEGQHLQSVYETGRRYGGPGIFGFDPNAALTESSSLVREDSRSRLFADWARYWDLEKPVLLEKSPPNLIRTRFLQALFPNSYFLVLLRHPLAVSYATQKWSGTSLEALIEHWLVCHDRFLEDKSHLQRVLVLRYEDFVSAPRSVLETIYGFLRIPAHPTGLEVLAHSNQSYFQRWQHHRTASIEVESLISRYEPRVRRFGYSLNVPELSCDPSGSHDAESRASRSY
jgi:hypothetical protein